eukprot:COSAG01_NODE_11277_length_1967_cov_1.981263_1_plen_456_part_00
MAQAVCPCRRRLFLRAAALAIFTTAATMYATHPLAAQQQRVRGQLPLPSLQQPPPWQPPWELAGAKVPWLQDGLDHLGLDNIANGTSRQLLDQVGTRLATRTPFWSIRNVSRCLPYFLLIGTMKSGTTALATYLQQAHGDIYMSAKKEPNFFAPPCGRRCPVGAHYYNLRYYFSLFPTLDPHTAAGKHAAYFEATPSYLFSSADTPARLHSWLPDARLVLLIRDPVERAYSQYQLGLSLLREDRTHPPSLRACNGSMLGRRSFDELVRRALVTFRRCVVHLIAGRERAYYACKRRAPAADLTPCDRVVTASSLINPGLYAYHIERFLRYYRRDQLLILESEALAAQPERTLRHTLDFLGVSPLEGSAQLSAATFKVKICPRFFGITALKTSMSLANGSAPASHLAASAAHNTKPCDSYGPMSAVTRARLMQFYEPHNQRLYALLGRTVFQDFLHI